MNLKKLLLIVNLHAGKGTIAHDLAHIIDYFVKEKYEVCVYTTQSEYDATKKVVLDALYYDLIVCSGGDGTLDEVVRGMMVLPLKKRIPIGYIPSGTTNDFANSLQLPKNALEAAKVAILGKSRWIDVGLFNQKYFLYVAAFGIFTEVSYSTPQDIKNNLGRIAYILEGIKSLTNIQSYSCRIEVNDEIIEDRFIYGQITNSTSVGGFQILNPETIDLEDGVFEMLLIRQPKNLLDLQNIIGALLLQDLDSEWLVSRKIKHVKLSSEEAMSWTLDGEFGGNVNEVELDNVHAAINIVVGQ